MGTILVLVSVGLGLERINSYQLIKENALRETDIRVAALEVTIQSIVQRFDNTLLRIQSEAHSHWPEYEAKTPYAKNRLANAFFAIPETQSLRVVAAGGNSVADASGKLSSVNVGDRPCFQQAQRSNQLVIREPFFERRSIESLNYPYDAAARFTRYKDKGLLIASYPSNPAEIGQPPTSPVIVKAVTGGLSRLMMDNAFIAVRRIAGTPLYVVAEMDTDRWLLPWRNAITVYVAAILLVSIGIGINLKIYRRRYRFAKEEVAKATRMAHHDHLTGLPNKILLYDRIQHAIVSATRDGSRIAVMFIDLDKFKQINDTLGHSFGDQVLKVIANRLTSCIRNEDTLCRLGGDEFIVVSKNPQLTANRDLYMVERMIAQVSIPIVVAGIEVHLTPSVGISIFPNDGIDADQLLRSADIAMYSAKNEGRGQFAFFTESMNQRVQEIGQIERDIRKALERGQFSIYLQPKVTIPLGNETPLCVGYEALMRWKHPDKGMIPPEKFIPVAEMSDLINPMWEWTVRLVARSQSALIALHRETVPIAINLSATQFRKTNLPDIALQIIQEEGCPINLIDFEVTENVCLNNIDQAIDILSRFRGMGFEVALDDFGTGFSSLAYLQRLPISTLKLDKAFCDQILIDDRTLPIIRSIVALANNLSLSVVVEGIETADQSRLISQCGGVIGQGYFYGKPRPMDDVMSQRAEQSPASPEAIRDYVTDVRVCAVSPMPQRAAA